MNWRELFNEIPTWEEARNRPASYSSPLASFHDGLETYQPENVSAVIAIDSGHQVARRPVRLITVAKFRTQYSIISRMAKSLAPAVLATGAIPIIQPVQSRDLVAGTVDPETAERFLRRGVRLWGNLRAE